jgi:hypothetical protein
VRLGKATKAARRSESQRVEAADALTGSQLRGHTTRWGSGEKVVLERHVTAKEHCTEATKGVLASRVRVEGRRQRAVRRDKSVAGQAGAENSHKQARGRKADAEKTLDICAPGTAAEITGASALPLPPTSPQILGPRRVQNQRW